MLTLNVMWIASQYGDYGGQLIKMNFGTYNWKKFLVSQTHKITIWALMPAKVELLWYNGEVWVCAQSLSHVQLFVTPRTIACQAPMSIGFSKWEYWSGLPFPSPKHIPKFSSVQSLSPVRLFVTPWIAARQASLYITNSWSSLKLTSIEPMMPSSYLNLCCPLLLLPPIPPSIRVFSNESTLRMRWP